MPEPKPPRGSPWLSTALAGTRATPTSCAPAKAGKARSRHNKTNAVRIGLQIYAKSQEELARRRGMGHHDRAGGIVRCEHAVVVIRGEPLIGQVGDIEGQLRAVDPTEAAKVITDTGIKRGVGAEALIVGIGVVAAAGELGLSR